MESNNSKKIFLVIGLFFCLAGVLFNQWTIGMFRHIPRPITQTKNLFIIWTFQIVSIAVGLFFISNKNKPRLTGTRFIFFYKNISAALVSLLIGLVLMNIVLYSATVIQTSLGGGNPISQKYGISPESLYPNFDNSQYAELMKETWSRGFSYEPFTGFKEGAYKGVYVNVDESGFRYVKNQKQWPPQKTNFNIFIFGNSTVFNYGVPDDETIASQLQEFLNQAAPSKNVAIYNFGRGFYYSSQERALYEKLIIAGYVPDAAVFIDGQEEFEPDYVNDSPQFTKELQSVFSGGSYSQIFNNLPMVQWWKSFMASKKSGGVDLADNISKDKEKYNSNEGIQRYLENKKLIETVSSKLNVKPFFIWQPVSVYKYDLSYEPFSPTAPRGVQAGYACMSEYVENHSMGNDFLYLADIQVNIKKPLYVDGIHYSGEWSGEVASKIYEFLKMKLF